MVTTVVGSAVVGSAVVGSAVVVVGSAVVVGPSVICSAVVQGGFLKMSCFGRNPRFWVKKCNFKLLLGRKCNY